MPTSDYIIGEADVTVDTPDGVCITFKVSNAQIINEREILEHFSSRSGVRIRENEVLLSSSTEFKATLAGDVEVLSEGNTKNINTIRIIRFCKRLQKEGM